MGKGKKQSPAQRQTSSFTSSRDPHDEPALAANSLMASSGSTSGPHQTSNAIDIDFLIKKRFEFLRQYDTSQRKQLGLPRSRHNALSRLYAKDHNLSRNWEPLQPRTQDEFEQKRNNARLLIDYARELLKSRNHAPRVMKLCQKVITAADKADERPKPKPAKWYDLAASARRTQALPNVNELNRMEEILYGGAVTKQPTSKEESDERLRFSGKIFDFALATLKNDSHLKLENARGELLTICSNIVMRRVELLQGKRTRGAERSPKKEAYR
ncbi:hypothetical protein FA10DRAFT_64578 [Acaromyces ingoldii]|uniref:Uncharacterized protein n=1 Tax=Acaromyces ingoldii TaxID=215250 RepID=A0A316YQL3_9BASI|nr:hypothetical protein FA10DRAFT_64578 [Acaromyces ingoldii]PWN91306.1 hypothetical protein FA10DRAFT_64578 [Acaromyces ingoldii]